MTMTLKPLTNKRAQHFEFEFVDRSGQLRSILIDAYDRAEALSVLHEAVHCITDLLAAEARPQPRPRYQPMPHEVQETEDMLESFAQRFAGTGTQR
jgi:hypothetical protein